MSDDQDSGENSRGRSNLLVIGAVLVVIVVGGLVMYFLKQNLDLQKCELERRMDCHAIPLQDNSQPAPPPR